MKKADISTFENVAEHNGGYVNVTNAKAVRNVGAISGALSLVSGLPTLSKVGKLTKGDKFQKVAQKVMDTAKTMASAAGATTSLTFGYPIPPEDVAASIDAVPSMIPEKFLKAGEKVLHTTDQALESLARKLKSDKSMVGPVIMACLMTRGYLSAEQAETILSHQNSALFLPLLCSSAKAGLSFTSAVKLFAETVTK